jgi:tetratricopeptide (TPR) repeat protein
MNAMQALELVMQGSPSEVAKARELFQSAVDADPDYTFALAWIGKTHWFDVRFGFSDSPEASLSTASDLAERALKQNPLEPYAHHVTGAVLALQGRHEEAVAEDRTSIQLSPNDAYLKMGLARVLVIAGRPEEAETHVREAMRLNPHYPNLYLGVLANALEEMRRDSEAVEILRTAIGRDPNYFPSHLRLASLLALAGRLEEAGSQIKEALRTNPRFNLTRAASFYPTSNPESLERFVDGLRKAGLPE